MTTEGMHSYWVERRRPSIKFVPWVPISYEQGLLSNGPRTFVVADSGYRDWERYATPYWISKFLTGGDNDTYGPVERAITGASDVRDFRFWKSVAWSNFFQVPIEPGEQPDTSAKDHGRAIFRVLINCPLPPSFILVVGKRVWDCISDMGAPGEKPKARISGRSCETRIFTNKGGQAIAGGWIDHPSYWKYIRVSASDWHPVIRDYVAMAQSRLLAP
jgi:hypothetical protein